MGTRNVVLCAFQVHLQYTKPVYSHSTNTIMIESEVFIQRGNDVDKGVTRSRSYINGGVPDDARAFVNRYHGTIDWTKSIICAGRSRRP